MVDSAVPELIGVGSPLVDLLLTVDDALLTEHVSGAKGGMEMVEADAIAAIVKKSKQKPVQAAGGAASNTTVGCANLGIRTAFIGSCGSDDLAAYYRDKLTSQGCEARLVEHPVLPTGRVLSLVTPDAQRTMRTCLGAAAALDPALFSASTFAGARVVMLEGYTLFNHELTRAIARAAKAAGAELALDLASFEVVKYNHGVLEELLAGQVDIVFANEDEAAAWTGGSPEQALADLAGRTRLAVVKLGKEGAWIARGGERVRVGIEPVESVVDTTGAGDCWAAGFLAGHLRGLPLAQCGRLGALCGAAVVQVMGAQVPSVEWTRIKGFLDAWT
jgi:sugar/nucleoside kinase (ribokinase family)